MGLEEKTETLAAGRNTVFGTLAVDRGSWMCCIARTIGTGTRPRLVQVGFAPEMRSDADETRGAQKVKIPTSGKTGQELGTLGLLRSDFPPLNLASSDLGEESKVA